jgi:hypothetical protein
LAVAFFTVTAALTDGDDDAESPGVFDGASLTREVIYEVEGSARSVNITIETPSGTSQQNDLVVPIVNKAGETGLRSTFTAGDFVYISAQNQGEHGTVTCRITSDGVVISENTASGAYAIASCKGSA